MLSAALLDASSLTAVQRLHDLAREQATRSPGEPLLLPAPPHEIWPKPIEEVAREADLIVQATLACLHSYLNPTEDVVLTDYSMPVTDVVAGRLSAESTRVPAPTRPLTLTVFGGEVVVEGIPIRATDQNRAPVKDGGHYLLFLRPSRSRAAGCSEVYEGGIFEIVQDEVKPLLNGANRIYKGTVDARLEDFIRRIRMAVQAR